MTDTRREVLLGVGGGIAAYKSADLIRRLQDVGFAVTVIPTQASLNFVGKATWEALSGREVPDNLWNNVHSVPHISLARRCSTLVVAPCTADLLAKFANGLAPDLLTNVFLATNAPIILVPAMHPEMWLNAATQSNVEALRSRGIIVIEPDNGRLTGADSGPGRLPEVSRIIDEVQQALNHKADLVGVKILISAGGTQEPIDAVRFIGNRSSGKQGYSLAVAAANRGADVSLVLANSSLPDIDGVEMVRVVTAKDMQHALEERFDSSSALIMSAAIADIRPANPTRDKVSKEDLLGLPSLPIEQTEDILAALSAKKGQGQILIGFAAQTGPNREELAFAKLQKKGLDLIYVNDVSGGAVFGSDMTAGAILDPAGTRREIPSMSKDSLSNILLDSLVDKLG
jgi:phosphopantothenoylcysteine decarboxylase/phosphopantothenate--cysteine ligase